MLVNNRGAAPFLASTCPAPPPSAPHSHSLAGRRSPGLVHSGLGRTPPSQAWSSAKCWPCVCPLDSRSEPGAWSLELGAWHGLSLGRKGLEREVVLIWDRSGAASLSGNEEAAGDSPQPSTPPPPPPLQRHQLHLAPCIWLCGLEQAASLCGPLLSHLYNGLCAL